MAQRGDGVLIIVENLPVPFDRRVWMEANALRDAGYQVSIICPTGKGYESRFEVLDDIEIYRHPLPPDISSVLSYLREYSAALFWEWRLARQIRRKREIKVIHICNPPDLLFLVAVWFKALGGSKIIYDQHDLNPEMYEAKYGRRDVFYHALRAAEWLTFKVSDAVIATNESHREVALTRGGKRAGEVFIVRSGPDLSRFKAVPRSDAPRRKGYVVGYVGVMGEPEGIDVLLYAAHHLIHVAGRKDINFVLIGGGPKAADLRDLASSLNLSANVEFTGRIPDEEMLRRLSECDVCVAPDIKSAYNDKCTMNKVLEYMALGKPVVQFDLIEGRRSAADASAYVEGTAPEDFANELVRLLDDPARRERMGRIGRLRMESELEWRHQRPKLIAAYQSVE